MKKTIFSILKTVLPLGFGVFLIWYFFTSMSVESKNYFYDAIKRCDYTWIFASLLLSFLAFSIRAYRWKFALEPLGYKTKYWNRYHALMIGYLVNLTIPRAGEASRSAMLYRSDGVPFSKSFGTIVAERAIDLVMLGGVALLTAALGYEDFQSIFSQIKQKFGGGAEASSGNSFWFYLIVAIAFIIGIFVLKRMPGLSAKIFGFAKDVFAGVIAIFKSEKPFAYLFYTLCIWALYLLYFGIAFYSLEETKDFPIDGIFLAFIAGSLGITFTNGGIGTFPLLVGLVIVFFMGDKNPNAQAIGNALGMLIWTSQTLLLIIMGLVSLVLLPKNYTKENDSNSIYTSEEA